MPLKPADLKTIEAYKKAIRMDLPKLASGAKFWIYKDVELPNSSGKKEKIASFVAFVDHNAIRQDLAGRQLVCSGTCEMKDGKIAFTTATGKLPVTELKKSVQVLLGKAMHEGEPDQPSSLPPPPTGAAALTTRWDAMVKQMQATIASRPEKKADIVRASAGIADMIKAGKFDLAKKLMDGVDAVLAVQPGEKEYRARYEKIEARWLAALKEPANDASRLRAMNAFIVEKAESGDFSAALQGLKRLEDALGSSAGAPPRKPTGFSERWAAAEVRVKEALRVNIGDVGKIRSVAAFIQEKAQAKDVEAAEKALDRLDDLLSAAFSAKESQIGTRYQGVIRYRQALSEFDGVKAAATQRMAALRRSKPELLPDDKAKALSDWINKLNETIEQAKSLAKNEESPVNGNVRASLDRYLAEVGANELIRLVDQNSAFAVSIEAMLRAALAKIKAALPTLA